MRASTDSTKAKRYLEMARQIAEGEKDFISYSYEDSPISHQDFNDLADIAGEEMICFDDTNGIYPNARTVNERVVFLCFAAAVIGK